MHSSAALIILSFFVWHLTWNMILNKSRGLQWVSAEQVLVSLITGMILQSLAGWSPWLAITLAVIGSLAYYINLIHIRFFGELIAISQIKQFLISKNTASASGEMLFQAAGRLVKWGDAYFVILLSEAIVSLFIGTHHPDEPLWKWWALNGLLLLLIAATIRQYRSLRRGAVSSRDFGMFISYYFSWLLERRRRSEQANLHDELAAQLIEAQDETESEHTPDDEWFGKFKGMNVVLIQLESFQRYLLNHKVEGQEVTPFLNRMANEHIAFTDIFSQYGQGHTSDAELAVLHSLYPLKQEVVNYNHYDKKYYGLPSIMRNHGYQAMAYHGYKGDFYNRRMMMKTHGFESFVSEEDYMTTDRACGWMSDFSFFEQSVEKIKGMRQPFFAFMISLTSHFPFKLEERHWKLNLSKEVPEFLAHYYQCVNYTDRALQHFYECMEREGLLDNTVLACYGDHEGVTTEHFPSLCEELGMNLSNHLKISNRMSMAQVPFIIASGDPERKLTLMSDKVGSTLDVGQTLLHLLGIPKIGYGSGMNLFTAPDERVVPLSQYPLGSYATHDLICYAPASGDYVKSVIYDRKKEKLILPVSGTNKDQFDYSRQQISRSEYLIVNDLLVTEDQSNKVGPSTVEAATFMPNIERILSIAEEESIILPLTLALDQVYLKGQKNDADKMKRLEAYYKETRKKNIRFFSTLDLEANDTTVYFGDPQYSKIFINNGYKVELVQPVALPQYMAGLPDHSLIVSVVKDDGANKFDPQFAEEMVEYGIHRLNKKKYRHSYMNLIYKNKGYVSLFEEVSELPIEMDWECGTILNGIALPFHLQAASKGARVGNMSEIKVNGFSCSKNQRGLNFAVVDMNSGKVIDMFVADTCVTTTIANGMYRAIREAEPQEVMKL
ncbi:LTA synthase family protein [Cohnella cholangitidis]|uniref:Sulfatase-like hydrolase/transferase n=1 Tax=Cohnella cholangitidis TaxID=2598458 RepID=A0A7G5BYA9_9BACL|nr:LTA synthase family protein [Cohnella cholangitidis]QMV41943.1 sulfatase-like hydrolase/transferase [Cohnella cholangitidis]